MKQVRKAIIPAAGLGTRFLPATKAMPKGMLPIVDKPTIQYIVEEAVASGIENIMIITGKNKRSIEDHFDRNYELEMNLAEKKKSEMYNMVRSISNIADIHYIRQKEALGLGHAVLSAKKFIGDEPFAVLLGDMIIDADPPCLKQMLDIYEKVKASVIGVGRIAKEELSKYGVIDGVQTDENVYKVSRLVEKPKISPPSDLGIIGRYVLEADIFPILEQTKPGVGGEIQLTDGLQSLASNQPLYAGIYNGKLYDVGDKLGFLKANIEFACRDITLREPFSEFLRSFVAERRDEG